jgi:hypothetical protein
VRSPESSRGSAKNLEIDAQLPLLKKTAPVDEKKDADDEKARDQRQHGFNRELTV